MIDAKTGEWEDLDEEHQYECDGCREVYDDREKVPYVIPPAWSSADGLPTVLCPDCREPVERAGARFGRGEMR